MSEGESIYEILIKIWLKELEENELTEVPFDIYEKVSGYLRQIKESDVPQSIRSAEEKFIRKLVLSLFKIRITKLITAFLSGVAISTEDLPPEEREVLNAFRNSFDKILIKFSQDLSSKVKEKERRRKSYVLIRFRADIPRFVGSDNNIYGPFRCEDVAFIPSPDAEDLISKGLAIKIAIGV
ncbi:MAG: hypothetical protein DRJ66_01705 [Thermoprotei archaeon]|nr:MAG: hypothetical protein DRJ66_01705 [Thermoprotei archaeon]RLF19199.1 MAG: hypothetical protein DRZ82_06485 [Thermoprotei archaeon]